MKKLEGREKLRAFKYLMDAQLQQLIQIVFVQKGEQLL